MTDLAQKLLPNTYTENDLRRRLSIIRSFFEHLFFKDETITLENFLNSRNIPPSDTAAILSYNKNFYTYFSPTNYNQVIRSILKSIKEIPNITIYLPIDTNVSEIAKLGTWFRKNISATSLLDIRYDDKKIGGCALVTNNIYRDYSLHHFISKKRQDILDLVNNYQNIKNN